MKILTTNQSLKTITLVSTIALFAIPLKPALAENKKGSKSNQPAAEIGWSSRLSSMGLDKNDNVGKKYKFDCQAASEELIHAPIWGTKIYTVNSGICSTAVHAGMIAPEKGGEVTIKLLDGKDFYTGSHKNEVASQDHRNTDLSFTFVGKKVAQDRQEVKPTKEQRQPSTIEKILIDGFQRGVERSIENTLDDLLN